MSSQIRPLEDIAQCDIAYWLPPGGRDNGVWADIVGLIADLDSDDAAGSRPVGEGRRRWLCGVPGWEKSQGARPGPHSLWVDAMQYGLAEEVLILFMRSRVGRSTLP